MEVAEGILGCLKKGGAREAQLAAETMAVRNLHTAVQTKFGFSMHGSHGWLPEGFGMFENIYAGLRV